MQLQLPQLWLFDLRPLMQDERWRAFLPELPIERQARALSCRREEDAARITGAGFLLQQALLFPYPSRFSGKTTGESRILSPVPSNFL